MNKPPTSDMIARVSAALSEKNVKPILIGGMAMVIHGSTRMTRDVDLATEKSDEALRASVGAMLDLGFAVIFGWDAEKYQPTKLEIDKATTAAWAVIDRPESIWFWHLKEHMRFDLVFDLPVSVAEMLTRAETRTIHGIRIHIASPEDLVRMKEFSLAARPSRITDEQDLVFLRHLIKSGDRL